jgi:hypothetical protein
MPEMFSRQQLAQTSAGSRSSPVELPYHDQLEEEDLRMCCPVPSPGIWYGLGECRHYRDRSVQYGGCIKYSSCIKWLKQSSDR